MSPVLPPLPPMPDDGWGGGVSGRGMIDLLIDEHHELRLLLADLADLAGPPDRRTRVAAVLIATVSRHLCAEEQYLYPTVRAMLADGSAIADDEISADRHLLRTLRQLAATTPQRGPYEYLVRLVDAQLTRHIAIASRRILPRLRVICPERDLIRLGNRIAVAQEAAPTRPHPGAPHRPPWNKIIDPAIGVADKIRDVLAGRPTYPADI